MDDQHRVAEALANRYQIEGEIGAGGMATVYLAQDLKHHRQVAVKVLAPDLAQSLGNERFLREVETAAKLAHPHILPLFDSGEADGLLYYVMPFVKGESLRDRLLQEKQLPIEEALKITEQVASALGYAHRHGVIHRDIKPENILMHEGEAMVADFGIALAVSAAGGERLTATGHSLGTPAYMSPEQIAGDGEIDARSDIYSLGCVLYEMLAGDPPFTASTPQAVLSRHLTDPVPPVTTVRSSVPPPVAATLEKALGKVPADRFTSAEEMAKALRGEEGPGEAARTPEASGLGRQRLAAAVTALVAVVALIAWLTNLPTGEPAPATSRIAVLPWAVRGGESELSWLDEGMVDLLSANFDGVAGLSSVDPYALIGFVKQRCQEGIDPQCGRAVAEEFGAARFILGSAVPVGTGRFELTAALYGAEGDRVTTEQASGSQDAPWSVIDELTRKLLASQPAIGDPRLTSIAAQTTLSVAALRAYLDGERAFRVLDIPTADEAFRRAIAEDSTFALAYYRLAMIALWGEQDSVAREMTARAIEHREGLSERASQLIDALEPWVWGDAQEMQRRYQVYLAQYPDDAEGWWLLAESQLHWNPLYGRSMRESRPAFERALEYYPDLGGALLHLAQLAAVERRYDDLDSLAQRFSTEKQEPTYVLAMRAMRAFTAGDEREQEDFLRELASADNLTAPPSPVFIAVNLQDFASAKRLLGVIVETPHSDFVKAFAHTALAHLHLTEGRWAANRGEMDVSKTLNPALGIEHEGFLLTASFLPATQSDLEEYRERLEDWSAVAPPNPMSAWWATIHDGLHAALRLYLLGRVASRLDQHDLALRYAGELESQELPVHAGSLADDLALGLRAMVFQARGRTEEALAALEDIRMVVSYPFMIGSPFHSRANERWLRAEVLADLGRHEEAIAWYGTLEEVSLQELIYLAPSHFKRGQMHEHLGNTQQALEHYDRFIELWQECDPELRPLIDDAQGRIARLSSEAGR